MLFFDHQQGGQLAPEYRGQLQRNLHQWLSASIALATLLLAIRSMLQDKKIKELTGLVEELAKHTGELKKHTEVLNKRFELETEAHILNTIPTFRIDKVEEIDIIYGNETAQIDGLVPVESFSITFHLANVGKVASNFVVTDENSEIFNVIAQETSIDMIRSDELIKFNLKGKRTEGLKEFIPGAETFEFLINFQDSRSNNWSQKIAYYLQFHAHEIQPATSVLFSY